MSEISAGEKPRDWAKTPTARRATATESNVLGYEARNVVTVLVATLEKVPPRHWSKTAQRLGYARLRRRSPCRLHGNNRTRARPSSLGCRGPLLDPYRARRHRPLEN